jgi:hypothetical protein
MANKLIAMEDLEVYLNNKKDSLYVDIRNKVLGDELRLLNVVSSEESINEHLEWLSKVLNHDS